MSSLQWIIYNVALVVLLVFGENDLKFEASPYKTLSIAERNLFKIKVDEFEKNWKLHKTIGDDSYEYIFEWNCFCATCLELPKSINVKEDKIVSIKFSDELSYDYYDNEKHITPQAKKEFNLKIPNFGCDNLYLHSKHYHNIEGLFHILQQSLHPNFYDPNRHIISMTFDADLSYPKTVYISNDLHELGWNVKCLSMSNDEDTSCSNNKQFPFWIEKKWQEIIATLMILLVLFWSCVGWIIACLKKRARALQRKAIRKRARGKKRSNVKARGNNPVNVNNAAHRLRPNANAKGQQLSFRGAGSGGQFGKQQRENRSDVVEEQHGDIQAPGS